MSSQVIGPGKRRRRLCRWTAAPALALLAALLGGCAWGITQPAEDVGVTSATITGIVAETSDGTATYWFEYGPTKNYGSETSQRSIDLTGGETASVSEDLSGLDPESKYHFRLCAREPGGSQPQEVCGGDQTFRTGSGPAQLAISTDPGLYPDFDPDVPDYVTRCNDGPVDVDVEAPVDEEVSVDGGPDRNGTFTETVPLGSEQEFSFRTQTDVGTSTYHVRCLPNNFPDWTFDQYGPAQRKWYITTNNGYVIIFDGNGVPVWWRAAAGAVDAKLLADGTLAFGATKKYEIRTLDGTLLHTLKPVGADADTHDMLLLPDGNYMVMAGVPRPGTVDLTAFGGPADATVLDNEVQEIDPDGDLIWSWNTKDHIGLEETPTEWWQARVLPNHADGYDVVHMNALDIDSGSLVVSLRHTNAAYEIDRDSGDVVWKLGGTPTPESLNVIGDPATGGPFGGQHDVRLHSDGTLTAFDNGQTQDRPPRAVRFGIDPEAGTATYLESISGLPEVAEAVCCGSARRSPSGSWLVDWGRFPLGTNGITEVAPDGTRTFRLVFATNPYRTVPVPAGKISRAEMRDGMDVQHPR